jgi:hypothetical protein
MPVFLLQLAAVFAAVTLFLTSQSLIRSERAAAADPGYLMVHFTGDSATGQRLYLAHSAGLPLHDRHTRGA